MNNMCEYGTDCVHCGNRSLMDGLSPSASSDNIGGIVGGVVGGSLVPLLLCILWLCGVFARYGCPSPLKKHHPPRAEAPEQAPASAGVEVPNVKVEFESAPAQAQAPV